MACLGKPWENFVQLLLFDHFYEGSRYLTQVIGFAWQAFGLLNYEITKAYINRARAKNRHRNREKKITEQEQSEMASVQLTIRPVQTVKGLKSEAELGTTGSPDWKDEIKVPRHFEVY